MINFIELYLCFKMFKVSERYNIPFFVMRSALQKFIRRGMLFESKLIVSELDMTGLGNSVFTTMKVISAEDIGLANLNVIEIVNDYHNEWKDILKDDDVKQSESYTSERAKRTLMKCVTCMVKSKKSRLVDNVAHFLNMYDIEDGDNKSLIKQIIKLKKSINNDKYDKEKEIKLLRLVDSVYVNSELKILEPYKSKRDVMKHLFEVLYVNETSDVIESCFYETKNNRLLILFNALLITRPHIYTKLKISRDEYSTDVYDYDEDFDIPDFVFDKHTSEGKRKGRGIKHFYDIGALIKDENEDVLNEYYDIGRDFDLLLEKLMMKNKNVKSKSLYELRKEGWSDSKIIKFRDQYDLSDSDTSDTHITNKEYIREMKTGKPSTFYGDYNGVTYFFKGPLRNLDSVGDQLWLDSIKDNFDIKKMNCKLYDDDKDILYDDTNIKFSESLYLRCDKFNGISIVKYKDKINLNDKQLYSYTKILLFRYLFGVSDTNNTNIMIYKNRCYSVDEMTLFHSKIDIKSLRDLWSHNPGKDFILQIEQYMKENEDILDYLEYMKDVSKDVKFRNKDERREFNSRYDILLNFISDM